MNMVWVVDTGEPGDPYWVFEHEEDARRLADTFTVATVMGCPLIDGKSAAEILAELERDD